MRLPAVRADMLHPSITATVRKFLIQGDSGQLDSVGFSCFLRAKLHKDSVYLHFALAKDARPMHYKVSHASC